MQAKQKLVGRVLHLDAQADADVDALAAHARGSRSQGARQGLRFAASCIGAPVLSPAVPAPAKGDENPIRAIREAAGLSQYALAPLLKMKRGALANAEKAATATPDMVARVRAMCAKHGAKPQEVGGVAP